MAAQRHLEEEHQHGQILLRRLHGDEREEVPPKTASVTTARHDDDHKLPSRAQNHSAARQFWAVTKWELSSTEAPVASMSVKTEDAFHVRPKFPLPRDPLVSLFVCHPLMQSTYGLT